MTRVTEHAGSAFDWFFRNRRTGQITIGQPPNVPLLVGIGALGVRMLWSPGGAWETALGVVGYGAMLIWAADELLRGVNPFRRLLGAGVLAWLATSLLTR